MKYAFLIFILLSTGQAHCQCPLTVTLSTTSDCLGATLTASPAGSLSKIVWLNGTTTDTTVLSKDSIFHNEITVAGGHGAGDAAGQFTNPFGICLDANGNVYVADEGNNRVEEWTPGATSGIIVAGGNGPGSNASQLLSPSGVFVDNAGNIYVVDEGNSRVQKWASGANSGITVAGGNGFGSGTSQLAVPYAVYVDLQGNIYVSDDINDRIQKWPPGSSTGITVAGGNGKGNGPGQLDHPLGIFVDNNDNLFVADGNNFRVQEWIPGASAGITVAGGNGAGAGANQIYPDGVYVDINWNIYVADGGNNRIQEWMPGANAGITVAGGNGMGPSANQFNSPVDVRLDSKGNIYICDVGNDRIQEWILITRAIINANYTPSAPGSYTAVVIDSAGCTITTNAIILNSTDTPLVDIVVPNTPVCSGQPSVYGVSISNATGPFSYQWLVNGLPASNNTAYYTSDSLSNGDHITCQIMSSADCVLPASANALAMIKTSPVIEAGQVYSITYGQNVILQPVIDGDIAVYDWQPSEGLSDNTIRDPVGTPLKTTLYTLQVVSENGCRAKGEIGVDVNTPIKIPNAFTPNGDGKNDIFYVMGGGDGSRIKDFSIYNRWGVKVFYARNINPGDRASGWNGNINGQPAPSGTYVYSVMLSFVNGSRKTYQGTVILIR